MKRWRSRRAPDPVARLRRADFERSLQLLREMGMSDWALEYYRRSARRLGLLPHELVRYIAHVAAWRQLEGDEGRLPPPPRA